MILLLGHPGAKSKASVQSQGDIFFSSLCEGVGGKNTSFVCHTIFQNPRGHVTELHIATQDDFFMDFTDELQHHRFACLLERREYWFYSAVAYNTIFDAY